MIARHLGELPWKYLLMQGDASSSLSSLLCDGFLGKVWMLGVCVCVCVFRGALLPRPLLDKNRLRNLR